MEKLELTNFTRENRKISLGLRVSLKEEEGITPYLTLSFDEVSPQDESFCIQGVTFIVNKILLEQCGAINVDFIEEEGNSGFKITSENPLFAGHFC